MKNPKIILLVGAPCTGKTRWSTNHVQQNKNVVRLNRDEMRIMMKKAYVIDQDIEDIIDSTFNRMIMRSLMKGYDVIVDQTNCKIEYLTPYYNFFSEIADIRYKVFEEELSVLKRRNQLRAADKRMPPIPDDILERVYNAVNELMESREFVEMMTGNEYNVV